jgi:hypothetical protein
LRRKARFCSDYSKKFDLGNDMKCAPDKGSWYQGSTRAQDAWLNVFWEDAMENKRKK